LTVSPGVVASRLAGFGLMCLWRRLVWVWWPPGTGGSRGWRYGWRTFPAATISARRTSLRARATRCTATRRSTRSCTRPATGPRRLGQKHIEERPIRDAPVNALLSLAKEVNTDLVGVGNVGLGTLSGGRSTDRTSSPPRPSSAGCPALDGARDLGGVIDRRRPVAEKPHRRLQADPRATRSTRCSA
jgi:hypothetical protein